MNGDMPSPNTHPNPPQNGEGLSQITKNRRRSRLFFVICEKCIVLPQVGHFVVSGTIRVTKDKREAYRNG
jgi:hypothetical protein